MGHPDWDAEIDRWTERFRGHAAPPEVFAHALRHGWDDDARAALAEDAARYAQRHEGLTRQLRDAGWDVVRLDADPVGCSACDRYAGSAYSLLESGELPPAPPLPICPACRHVLNPLTPYFMSSLGVDMDDLVDAAVPYDPEHP